MSPSAAATPTTVTVLTDSGARPLNRLAAEDVRRIRDIKALLSDGTLDLRGHPTYAAELFIRYLEGAFIKVTHENAADLHAIARRFQSGALLQWCESALEKTRRRSSLRRVSRHIIRLVFAFSVALFRAFQRLRLRLSGFRVRHVQTATGAMHVMVADGTGPLPPLVVLHGVMSCAEDCPDLPLNFTKHSKRVILPTYLSHGQSERIPLTGNVPKTLADACVEAIRACSSEPVILLGHSLGGMLAVKIAHEHPELVRALILVTPAGGGICGEENHILELEADFDLGPTSAEYFIDRTYSQQWHPIRRWIMARGSEAAVRNHEMQSAIACAEPEYLIQPGVWKSIQAPSVVIWGARDQIIPYFHLVKFFKAHAPEGTLIEEIDGFAHNPFVDDPRLYRDLVTKHAYALVAMQNV